MAEESLKHKAKVGLYWKLFEQLSLYGMQFVVGIVMARLLSPSDFGVAALPSVFISLAQVFIDGSFGMALIRKPDMTERDLATTFYYSIGVGIVCYALIFFAAPWIAAFYKVPILVPLVRVTALTFLWGPLNTPQTVILNRRIDFKTPARISIVNKIVSAIVGITVAYLGYGIWALVSSTIISSFLGVVQTWFAVKWLPKVGFSRASFKYLWNFGNKMMAVKLLQQLYSSIVPIAMGRSGGMADLGMLQRADSFASMPQSLVGGIIGAVSFPVLSKIQEQDDRLERNYRKMIKDVAFIMFPMMMLLCALARPVVLFLIGEKWEPCIVVLQIACFTYVIHPLQGLNLNLLQVKGRTDLTLKLELIKRFVFAAAVIYAVRYGIVVLSLTSAVLVFFALIINTYYTGKLINVGFLKQMHDIFPSFLLSLVSLTVVFLVSQFIDSHLLLIVVGGTAGCLVYLLGAILFKFEELNDMLFLLKRSPRND